MGAAMKRLLLSLLVFVYSIFPAIAHEVRPAYLELRRTEPDLYNVLWKVPGLGDELRLALYVQIAFRHRGGN
jgi:hypothetical protein